MEYIISIGEECFYLHLIVFEYKKVIDISDSNILSGLFYVYLVN